MNNARQLPSVSRMLNQPAVADLLSRYNRDQVVDRIRAVLDETRANLLKTDAPVPAAKLEEQLAAQVAETMTERVRPSLQRVINATGIVLHTNLGRAPLGAAAAEAVAEIAAGYSTLEYDLAGGTRGSRHVHTRRLLADLVGAEDAIVVNNNASSLVLGVAALASKRPEVIVSAGELIEIGGSFRLPEVIAAGGGKLVAVGTTNRTHKKDFEQAITERTGLLLKAHPSNFSVRGFVTLPGVDEVAEIARRHNIPFLADAGSGILREKCGDEPVVADWLEQGADLVCFSGDKLLGGPQAGLIVGRKDLITRLASHPLMRALRVGKMTLAALQATLSAYGTADETWRQLPVNRLVELTEDELDERAQALKQAVLSVHPEWELDIIETDNFTGGGSRPEDRLPGRGVAITTPLSPDELAKLFRQTAVPVVGHFSGGRFCLDVRTLLDGNVETIAAMAATI